MSKTIIITGASSGIGRELAFALATPAHTLFLFGLHLDRLEEVAHHVRAQGAHCTAVAQDLTCFEECEALFQKLFPEGSVIDELYHCVGRATFGKLHHCSAEDLLWVHQTNLLCCTQWISLVYPRMVAQKSGKILLLSSLSGYTDLPVCASYAGTKRAMLALAHSLCPEARGHGVRFIVAFPGFIKTRIFEAGRYRQLDQKTWQKGVASLRVPILSSRQAAAILIRAANKNKARVIFPFYAKILAFVSLRMPSVNGLMQRIFVKQFD